MINTKENIKILSDRMSKKNWICWSGLYLYMAQEMQVRAELMVEGPCVSGAHFVFLKNMRDEILEADVEFGMTDGPGTIASAIERTRKTVLAVRKL